MADLWEQAGWSPDHWLALDVESELKTQGYRERERAQVQRTLDARGRRVPKDFDYGTLPNLSREMVERFTTVLPETLDQASRIPGVTSAALTVVRIAIEDQRRRRRGP